MESNSTEQTRLIYILYIVGAFIWLVMLVGVILAYIEKGKHSDEAILSHLNKQIRVFWIYLLLAIGGGVLLGILMVVVIIGALGGAALSGADPGGGAVIATLVPILFALVFGIALTVYVIVVCVKGLKKLDAGEHV